MKKVASIKKQYNSNSRDEVMLVEISAQELAHLAGCAYATSNAAEQFCEAAPGAELAIGPLFTRATEINEAWDYLAKDLSGAVKAVARLKLAGEERMPTPETKKLKEAKK
jgi:hypothetical protein